MSVPDKTSTPTATSKSSSSNKHNVKKLHNIKVSLNKSKIKKKEVIEKKTSPLLHKVNSDIEDYDEQDDCFDSILNRSNSLQEKNTDLHSSTNFEKRGTFKSIGEIDSSGIPTKKQNVQSDEVKKDKSNVNKASKNTLAASYFKKKSTNTSTDKIKEKLLPQYGKITKKSSSKIKLSSIRNLPKTNKEELLKQKEESKCPKEHFSEYDHQKIPKHKFDNSEHKTQKLEDSRNKFDECPSSNRVVFNNEIENKLDFSEEMDWEPYDEDLYLKNVSCVKISNSFLKFAPNLVCVVLSLFLQISKFRLEVNAGKKSSCEVFYGLNSNNIALPFQSNSGILIIDTNILISSLNFIKELRDTIILGNQFHKSNSFNWQLNCIFKLYFFY